MCLFYFCPLVHLICKVSCLICFLFLKGLSMNIYLDSWKAGEHLIKTSPSNTLSSFTLYCFFKVFVGLWLILSVINQSINHFICPKRAVAVVVVVQQQKIKTQNTSYKRKIRKNIQCVIYNNLKSVSKNMKL